jgi:hypothetical protein
MPARTLFAIMCACALTVGGCGSDPPPAPSCVTLRTDCSPLHRPPSFTNIFSKILQPTCAAGMGTCHTADVGMGGLAFVDEASSYDLLLGKTDGKPRVLPDNPGCGILAQRLKATDPTFRMPKGDGLIDAELCDFELWLTAGAPR